MSKLPIQIGIDLGTENTLVYIAKQGIVFNEPSVVAYDRATNDCIACGLDAKSMFGKTHDKIRVVKPMEGGVVADLDATKTLLQYVLSSIDDNNINWKASTLLLCCPSEVTVVEQNALLKLANSLGIGDCFIEQEVKAGAIGAGCDIYKTSGTMIVDIGGGSTDVGVLSCGDLVVWNSIRVAGRYIDREIMRYVKDKYKLFIGDKTAERVKFELATLLPVDEKNQRTTEVSGRHMTLGQPATAILTQLEVRALVVDAFEKIKHTIMATLEQTPPELSADILTNGIMFNGGTSSIPGIQEYFEKALNMPCLLSKNCLTSIVEGTKYLLKNRGSYLVKPVE